MLVAIVCDHSEHWLYGYLYYMFLFVLILSLLFTVDLSNVTDHNLVLKNLSKIY